MEKDMDSGRLFFDPSANRANMLFLGNNNFIFPVQRTMMMNVEDNNNLTKKRQFLSLPVEQFYDEEFYYDEQLPEKKRRLTPEQVVLLEKSFDEENKLEPEKKSELAKKLGLQPRQVAVWFQNRRARSKTKQLEKDYDVLKDSYHTLLSNYESVLKENAVLKSEVHSLYEKLQSNEGNVVGPRVDPTQAQQVDGPIIPSQRQLSKVEDMLSSGSGGSDVVNEENPHNVVDSGDSYFGCHPTSPNMPVVQSDREEDDISDDGRSYFSNIFTVATSDHQGQEEEDVQELGWWVWS